MVVGETTALVEQLVLHGQLADPLHCRIELGLDRVAASGAGGDVLN